MSADPVRKAVDWAARRAGGHVEAIALHLEALAAEDDEDAILSVIRAAAGLVDADVDFMAVRVVRLVNRREADRLAAYVASVGEG